MVDWEGLRKQIALDRGIYCWACGHSRWTELHHMLVHRKKGHAEYDVVENLCPVCSACHPYQNGYKARVRFWESQCQRYSELHMLEWLHGLPLRVKPRF